MTDERRRSDCVERIRVWKSSCYLFLIFVRCRRRSSCCFGRPFATRAPNRTSEECRLLLLRCCGLRRRRCAFRCCNWLRLRLLRLRLSLRLRLRRLTAGILPEAAVAEFPITTVAVGLLITIAATEAAFRPVIATVAELPAIIAIAVLAARSVAIVPVTAEVLAVATVVPVIVVTLVAIVPRRAIVVAILMIEIALLLRIRLLLLLLLRRLARRLLCRLDAELVALVLTELVAVAPLGTGQGMRASRAVAERIHATLLRHLLTVAQDDAVIMLGVLEIVFREDRVAGRERIASQ